MPLIESTRFKAMAVFYNVKELNTGIYTEQEYQTLESYLICEEQPVATYEPLSRLTDDKHYTVLKTKLRK